MQGKDTKKSTFHQLFNPIFNKNFQEHLKKLEGQIESIINELVPMCEKLGCNIEEDLHLEEYTSQNSVTTAIYEKGRIHRKEP
ncbi:MAG: hypothetical protein PWQ96_251 [Clostridia bacterium]|nr:hypothetical protein [Clostridia bacterium]